MGALERSVRLLEVLGGRDESVGVVQLSEEMRLPASTLHRLLAELMQYGLVVQEPDTRRYRIGPGVLRLARGYLQQNTLTSVAQPLLAELRSRVQETVFLTTLVGEDAVCVAAAESPRPLQFFMRLGQRMPVHAAASARAILAFRPASEVDRILRQENLARFTEITPTTPEDVRRELRAVRTQGFAVCDEEMEVGVTALSAPVRDASGAVTSSISIVAPALRLAETSVRSKALEALMETADHLSAALGYADAPCGLSSAPVLPFAAARHTFQA